MPCVIHVAVRTLAGEGLSISVGHQGVTAVRVCGWGMLSSQSAPSRFDIALVAHVAARKARVPTTHFQDGFRASHEISTSQLQIARQLGAGTDSGYYPVPTVLNSPPPLGEPGRASWGPQETHAWGGCTVTSSVAYTMNGDAFICPSTPSSSPVAASSC